MTGAEQAAEDAVARQVESFLDGGVEGARRGLIGLGWTPGPAPVSRVRPAVD